MSWAFAYYVCPPFLLLFGLGSNLVAALALYKESKKHTAYLYQVYDMLLMGLTIFGFIASIVTLRLCSGFISAGQLWFMRNYALMWYTAHLTIPLVNAFGLASLYFSVAVAADRVVAMAKPQAYTLVNHKRRLKISVTLSLFIGMGSSIFDMVRYYLVDNGISYVIVIDTAYTTSTFASFSNQFRNALQVVGILLVVLCNGKALVIFLRSAKELSGILNDKRITERQKVEKTLFYLTLVQGIEETIGRVAQVVYYVFAFVDTNFLLCEGRLAAPILEATQELLMLSRVFLAALVSDPFRKSIMRVIRRGNAVGMTSTRGVQAHPSGRSATGTQH